jgi:putative ATPase
VVSPLLSRSLLLTLEPLTDDDVREVLRRAVADPRGLDAAVAVDADAEDHLVRVAGGDARRALTALEAAAGAALDAAATAVDLATVEAAVQRGAVRYDRDGYQHYDVISAFIKSVRGSDVDAALHYLARMLEAGEDPRFVARRLMILASEDVGMADPSALQTAVAAAQTVQLVGMPEARITLAHATVHLALAPKSNAVYVGINEAIADVRRGLVGRVPAYLRDGSYAGAQRLGHGQGYAYPHDHPGGIVPQPYAPEDVRQRRYYRPTSHGAEARWGDVHARIEEVLRGGPQVGSGPEPEEPATEGS